MTNTDTPLDLVPRRTVFDIPDTATQLTVAKDQAREVTKVIDDEKLSMRIGRSEHVLFEGWATLGAFNGISVHTVWTRPLPDDAGWEARCEARTLDGRVVGTADAMCSRAERNWAKADDYAIRSMAQTRAGSKAFKGPLSWVMVLAGKSGTPAEEINAEDSGATSDTIEVVTPGWAQPVDDDTIGRVAHQLTDIFTAAQLPGAKPSELAMTIGRAIFDRCDDTIPVFAAELVQHLHAVLAPQEPAGGPPTASDGS